ncbi:MAG: type IV toxin-antitoxin system AbiEi family antitoxin domain-containing protein [Gemmatimonadaceae bacterium]|nr:type IV toxin-antitoxin system AbiEi family antitoxin domain-containing protein [Gemmatimonadaceae bacterium]
MVVSRDRLLDLARESGYVTSRDAARAGVHSQAITRMVREGELERVSAGGYRVVGAEISEHHAFVVACAAAPTGVICLLSALTFHQIGTQLPAQLWLAIERGQRAPKLHSLVLRTVQFSGAAYQEGIESHEIDRHQVRVYSVAKTIADLFKFRNRIGVDVAVEALRESWRDRRFRMEDLERAARACRVERVLRPYIEAVTH